MSEEIDILDKFKGYGFNGRRSIIRCIIGDNVFIVKDNKDGTYNFIKISKTDYNNFYENEKEKKNNNVSNAIINYINFDQIFFNKNEDKFIKSLNEQQLNFDKDIVKQMQSEEFKKLKVSGSQLSNINTFKPKLIPEPIPEEKEELMDDDDDDNERMTDEEEEEEKERMNDEEEEERPIEQVQDMDKKKDDKEKPIKEEEEEKQRKEIEEKKRKMKEEEDKEYEKQKKELFSDDYQNGLYDYDSKQKKSKSKKRSGKMDEKDSDVFNQLEEDLGFTKVKGPGGQSYLRVGNDVIFIRKVPKKKKDSAIFKNDPYLAVKLNEEDFKKLYNNRDIGDIKAEYFNFNTDYFNENKDKFKKAIKEGEFAFDDYIKEAKERLKKAGIRSDIGDKFTYKQIQDFGIIPGKKNFDYVKMFELKHDNISEERLDDGQQLFKFSKDGKNVTVKLPNKYLSNGYPDSLLKLIVGVSENNKGEVDFKEIGEIQDLNGDITDLYSDMQDLKTKINSSNNAEAKERLLIKYNKKRLKLEDLVKKYSKEAYRLSTLNKKKKATMATHKYLMNKLNKL